MTPAICGMGPWVPAFAGMTEKGMGVTMRGVGVTEMEGQGSQVTILSKILKLASAL